MKKERNKKAQALAFGDEGIPSWVIGVGILLLVFGFIILLEARGIINIGIFNYLKNFGRWMGR